MKESHAYILIGGAFLAIAGWIYFRNRASSDPMNDAANTGFGAGFSFDFAATPLPAHTYDPALYGAPVGNAVPRTEATPLIGSGGTRGRV